MKKILMFGRKGLISYRLKELLQDEVIALGSDEVDFRHDEQILQALNKYKPGIIINAAAYTLVDQAEDEPKIANQINGYAVGTIGKWAADNKAFVIHFSTDYVFDGTNPSGYKPYATPAPVNAYGTSKLLGERLLLESNAQAAIFRISWIYDEERGHNFFMTMKRLMTERSEISVVNDQHGMPTEAKWVAEKIYHLIKVDKLKQGIYHLQPEGCITWYEFALRIKEKLGFQTRIQAISSDQYKTKAKRPKWSKLIV